MGYHFGRYEPPPVAPALPPDATAAIQLPRPGDRGPMRLPTPASSAARTAELDVVRALASARTPAGEAWATHMDARGATSMWWGAAQTASRERGLLRGLELRTAIALGQIAGLAATYAPGQARHARQPRPYEMDPSITLVGHRPKTSSFPSGHTRQAFASATIVSRLDPPQAERAWSLASDVARSRIYSGAHVPSDVLAGAKFGIAVGDAVVGVVHAGRVAVPLGVAVGGAALLARAVRDD